MSDPTAMFTKNKFVNKMMSVIPEDPVTQSLYMYCLTWVAFAGLLGFSITSWINTIFGFTFTMLFTSLFMTAMALISMFGLKQSRIAYHLNKEMYSQVRMEQSEQEKKVEDSFEEMLEGFKKDGQ